MGHLVPLTHNKSYLVPKAVYGNCTFSIQESKKTNKKEKKTQGEWYKLKVSKWDNGGKRKSNKIGEKVIIKTNQNQYKTHSWSTNIIICIKDKHHD